MNVLANSPIANRNNSNIELHTSSPTGGGIGDGGGQGSGLRGPNGANVQGGNGMLLHQPQHLSQYSLINPASCSPMYNKAHENAMFNPMANTGSLPDLTSVHFSNTLNGQTLDRQQYQSNSPFSSVTTSPTMISPNTENSQSHYSPTHYQNYNQQQQQQQQQNQNQSPQIKVGFSKKKVVSKDHF